MTTNHLTRRDAAFLRRVEIAKRWHGLKTRDEIHDFLLHDPDVVEMTKDPEWRHAATVELIMQILTTDDVEASRKKYGRELVDKIFTSAKRYHDEDDA
jgi:hypothetical protein